MMLRFVIPSALRLLLTLMVLAVFPASSGMSQNPSKINDLQFDAVFPGVPKSVTKYTSGKAAEFLVTGDAGTEVLVDFTLPRYMSSNGYNMQMVFTDTDCSMDSSGTPDQSNPGNDDLDPWETITYSLGSGGLRIWLGGMLIPGLGQPPGSYSAVIELTITPTGI
jgi:hypothetical protein